jgi:hypothetical protein
LTDWLSKAAADGLDPRPVRSRDATCSSAQIAITLERDAANFWVKL